MGNCMSSTVTSIKRHAAARRLSSKLQHFGGQDYNELSGACRRQRVLFDDPLFPANCNSLGRCDVAESEILWLRPHVNVPFVQILYIPTDLIVIFARKFAFN